MRDLLIKDLGWKLFSLFLALGIWLTVHQINVESETVPVSVVGNTVMFESLPLQMVSSGADIRDFRLAPRTATVTVSVPPEAMARLQPGDIHATVNLTDFTNLAAVKDWDRPVEVSTPPGVTLVSIEPPAVRVVPPLKH